MIDNWMISHRVKDDWLSDCRDAATSDGSFLTFKRMPTLGYITENRHARHASQYWAMAKSLRPECISILPALAEADKVGCPLEADVAVVDGHSLSGATASSALVCSQIIHLFGNRPYRIAEIGPGYGNLAHCLKLFGLVEQYTFFDLIAPSMLQRRYIRSFGWDGIWPALGDKEPGAYDLSLSHSSLSELNDEAKAHYAARVLQRSTYGFHVWNFGGTGMGMTRCNSLFPDDLSGVWDNCYVHGNVNTI